MLSDVFSKFWNFLNAPLYSGTVEFNVTIIIFLAMAVIFGILFFKYK